MRALDIDADAKAASVQTGITAGEYTTATGEAGLVTGLGDAGLVGLGGITLAGGVGFLARKNGLIIDDLLAVALVTADGEVVEVTEESDADLFGVSEAARVTWRRDALHATTPRDLGDRRRDDDLARDPEVIIGFLEAAEAAEGALDHRQRPAVAADAVHSRGCGWQAGADGPLRLRWTD